MRHTFHLLVAVVVLGCVRGSSLEEELKQLQERVNQIEKREEVYKALTASAAFSVRLTEDATLSDSPLVYQSIDLNLGGGFDEFTGVFEPPLDGTYVLTVYASTAVTLNGPMYIKRNDEIICTTFVSEGEGQNGCSCTAVAQLVTGDSVRVTGSSDNPAEIQGSFSGFTGHIIVDGLIL